MRTKSRSKRRLLWGTALVALVLLGAGVLFYNTYFASTDAAIRHAEAFLFRRMTVAQLAGQGEYRFFYATNRVPGSDDASLDERFGQEREASLKFGSFDAEIKPSLGLGMLINPTEWFQNKEINLKSVRSLEQSAFVEQLRERVEDSPHRALLVVVHGFRERYPSALRKTAFLGHVLDINAPVLLFDWPGDQGSSLSGYRRARDVAKASGTELARMLELVIRDVQPDKLWLIANSMGGQVVADAFHVLYREA
ncbi:MAG: alpha/beta fold hydrolase, partial [Pseudomonadota bacterium]|nr:alpha/beta fold hydrolase [Pseudomonadota bacterium]